MDVLKKNWFSEINALWPGQCMSLEVTEILYHEKSAFQDIMILQTKNHGRALILDGVIQLTEADEFSYQEMMAMLPVNSHPNPENVLIVGGGDGGIARELDKHPSVKRVVMCEIDEKVIEVSKTYLPKLAKGFESAKLELHIGDGFEFMKNHKNEFDVIITDSSDPVGPAMSLFEKEYFELMRYSLREGGVICSQGECMWLHLELIKDIQTFCRQIFPVVSYAYMPVPTYPSGQIGCILCSTNPKTNFRKPLKTFSDEEVEQMNLKCYNTELHSACFALPQFAKKALEVSVVNGKNH